MCKLPREANFPGCRLACCVLLIGTAWTNAGSVLGSDIEEARSAFATIAELHRANWVAIQSWSGEVEVEDTRVDAGGPERTWESKVSFVYRANPRTLRWNWEVESPAPTAGHGMRISNGLIEEGRLTWLEIPESDDPEEANRSIRILSKASKEMSPLAQIFDPFYFRGPSGEDTAKRFKSLHDNVEKVLASGWKIARDGDIVVVSKEIMSSENDYAINRYTVDLSKGGNLIRFEGLQQKGSQPKLRGTWSWDYEKRGDVWVPLRMRHENEEFSVASAGQKAGELLNRSSRSIKWKSSTLNEPIGDSEFSLESMGVVDGDFVANTISGVNCIYRSEEDSTHSEKAD